jgi:hypothetical protein
MSANCLGITLGAEEAAARKARVFQAIISCLHSDASGTPRIVSPFDTLADDAALSESPCT